MDTPHDAPLCHDPSRNARRRVILGLSLWVLCLVCASDVWGRAGGGGGGGGGGDGGGGSSYSSGSSSGSSDINPACMCIFYGAVFCGWLVNKYEGRLRLQFPRFHGRRALNQVQESDPNFVLATFLEDFTSAFVAIQKAWMAQDMMAVRHFVSDGIDEKFAVQFREQQRLGYREQLDEISVRNVWLARFDSEGPFEVLTVKVTASVVDQRVSLKTGATIGGSSTAETFTEYWSLVRRRGIQTRQDGGRLLAGSCPNCGSPVKLNRLGSCQACDSLVRSGVYDWVLCEITQESEWQLTLPAEFATRVRQYCEQFDRGLSRTHLEDRAWVIMARLGLADALGDLAPLRKVALPQFSDDYELPRKTMRTNFSINGLDLVGFVVEDEGHFALLQVDWWRNEKSRESLLVLFRQAGVQSNQETALLTAHCPSCGAPEESQDTDACGACGQVTNTGKYGWVLRDLIEDRTSLSARFWRRRVTSAVVEPTSAGTTPLRPADCLQWAICHLIGDGEFSHVERDVIGKCATRNRIAAGSVDTWVEQAQQGTLALPHLHVEVSAEEWLNQLVGFVLHDGRITGDARSLLTRLAEILQLSHSDVVLAAGKQAYRKRVAHGRADRGGRGI